MRVPQPHPSNVCYLNAGRQQPAESSARLAEPGLRLRKGRRLYIWDAGRALGPCDGFDWPLWLHPGQSGTFTFNIAFYYEPVSAVDGMKYRYDGNLLLKKICTSQVHALLAVVRSSGHLACMWLTQSNAVKVPKQVHAYTARMMGCYCRTTNQEFCANQGCGIM